MVAVYFGLIGSRGEEEYHRKRARLLYDRRCPLSWSCAPRLAYTRRGADLSELITDEASLVNEIEPTMTELERG